MNAPAFCPAVALCFVFFDNATFIYPENQMDLQSSCFIGSDRCQAKSHTLHGCRQLNMLNISFQNRWPLICCYNNLKVGFPQDF